MYEYIVRNIDTIPKQQEVWINIFAKQKFELVCISYSPSNNCFGYFRRIILEEQIIE